MSRHQSAGQDRIMNTDPFKMWWGAQIMNPPPPILLSLPLFEAQIFSSAAKSVPKEPELHVTP
jgi:hypothetical protein